MSYTDKDDIKRFADGRDEQREIKTIKVDETVVETPEEETMEADLIGCLENTLKLCKVMGKATRFETSIRNGVLYSGTPDLGLRIQKFLERHGSDVARVFPRNLMTLTVDKYEDTVTRAMCIAPSIILLIGLECATPDVKAVIKRKIKEIADSCCHVFILGTTTTCGQVLEKLKGCLRY